MIRIRRLRANNFKQLREIDLVLPAHGRFLVQGKNEAGKSTLFEAVFFGIFGQPLVTETGTRRLDDLIRYGVEEAYVELWLEAPGRLLQIRRTIVRDKANDWQLDVITDDDLEEVRGNRPVNQRIVDEVGFDAEALLNTAFVEQKKLDKLEGMSRAQREQSLMKLLNLEQMMALEEDFKLRGDDRMALQRAEQRAELAQIQVELPERVERLAEIQRTLALIELRQAARNALRERSAAQQLAGEIDRLRAREAELAEQADQVQRLREGLESAREMYSLRERTEDAVQEIERLERELAEAETLRTATLPELEKQQQALALLRDRLARAADLETQLAAAEKQMAELESQLEALRETAEALAEAETQQRELAAEVDEHRDGLDRIDYLVVAHQVRQVLHEWLAAQDALEAPERRATALAEVRAEHLALTRRLGLEVLGIGVAIILAFVLSRVLSGLEPLFVVLAAGLLAALVWRVLGAVQVLNTVAERIGRLEGEREAAQAALEEHQSQLAAAEERLRELNALVPGTAERGRQAADELDLRLAEESTESLEELRGQSDAARESLTRARTLHEQASRRVAELEGAVSDADMTAARTALREARKQFTKVQGALTAQQEGAEQLAEALELTSDLRLVEGRLGRVAAEVANVERRVEAADTTELELARRRESLAELWDRIRTCYAELADLEAELPPWDQEQAADIIVSTGRKIRRAYDDAGGDTVQRQLQDVVSDIARKMAQQEERQKSAEAHIAAARGIAGRIDLEEALPAEGSHASTTDAMLRTWVEQAEVPGEVDEAELQSRRDELRERVGFLRQQQVELETNLGLVGETLDAEAEQVALADKRRELQVREKAQDIVELARRRIVEQILPNTMEHMRQVLPVLTMERYYDAELTDDYRIRVWDERAGQGGDWKEKNIFSGGTKDQFSLALRLAFALATLPEERGSAPSFIFLDEPLSSFDTERARALLHLLTEGQIAQSFDQIFLISHVRVNPELFNYHITVDQGRIVESDLPDGDALETQPAVQAEPA